MATAWPKKKRIIGTKVPRLDGPDKSTGRAKYSFDINRPGMLHAIMIRSPYAHAKVKSIDTAAAEKMTGFGALHIIAKPDTELFFAGDEVLAIAADTEEHALDIARAVKIDYEVLPFLVKEEDALKKDIETAPPITDEKIRKNVRPGGTGTKGSIDDGFKNAEAVVEGTYGVPTIAHQCLESHGLVAEWGADGDSLTVWCSTQAVPGTAAALANSFKLPPTKVKCITHYMGGGYGSKFGPDIQGITAAELARKAKKAVKLMLDRADEVTCGGNRPSAYGTIKIAGNKDGTITAFKVDCYGTPGVGGGATVNLGLLPYVYNVANYDRKHTVIRLNAGGARAMRAPGHPQNCYLTESAVDDLAAKLGIDPLIIRLKSLPENDADAIKSNPISWAALRGTTYKKELDIAVELSEWKKKWHPPGKGPAMGPVKHGIGMALHTWGGAAAGGTIPPNECTIIIARDGSVTAQTSTQDLGTGQKTVTAIVTAEILGLEPGDIIVKYGESDLGRSTGSGGSTTCPSQAPATLRAATAARDALFDKIAPRLNAKKENLSIEVGGKIVDAESKKTYDWKEACAKLGMETVKGEGNWSLAMSTEPDNAGVSNVQVGGVQTAEVLVDTETGVVRCTKMVAVQDCGLIVNKLCCESQVAGGVIMGVNYALFEDRIMDRQTGRQVNPDMEFYKLGGIEDMPKIVVHMHDMPERGVIGIGEPPTISTAAAIANAVHNALGIRVPNAPFSPANVLAALAKGAKS